MKKILHLLLLFIAFNTFSQKEANFWYFGRNAGVDFNTNPPTAVTNGQISTDEGCSSFSDADGNLLFYSDGISVFNKNHTIMNYSNGNPGNNLQGNPSSTQSGMIIPKPESSTIYYLFTVGTDFVGGAGNENPGFNYYTIDISKNNNLGEIIEGPVNLAINPNTNTDLSANWSEKVTAVKGKDCNTFWVISFVQDTFFAYKIDSSGVKVSEVIISKVNFNANDKRGYLNISPDGSKIAFADYNQSGGTINGSLLLFDFDNETGTISQNPDILIPTFSNESPYGVAFSRDSKKLYTSTYNNQFNVYQFNLEDINIASSKTKIVTKSGFRGALQLGPDGKIYVSIPDRTSLDAIENPNADADEVIYTNNAINLGGQITAQGLPPFISSLLVPVEIKDNLTKEIINDTNQQFCIGDDKTFGTETITGNDITYEWFFNDETTPIDTNTELVLTNISKANSGKYTLVIKLTDDCGNITQYEGSFHIDVFDAARAKANPEQINFCDTDPATPNSFDLTTKNTEVLDGLDPTLFNVKYYDTLVKANEGITGTEITSPYEVNTVSTQTIYARVNNNLAPNGCYAITEFKLEVTNEPQPNQPTVYRLCDDTASPGGDTDGITNNFILSTKDAEILGALNPTLYNVSYHTLLADALTSSTTNAIDKNADYQVTNSQRIFVRVENINNTNCNAISDDSTGSSFMSFQLIVDPLPVIKNPNPAQIRQCVNTIDGKSTINLTIAEGNVSSNPNGTFEYYEDQAETQLITNFTSYPVDANTNPAKIIWVKSISEFGCSRISELQLIIGTATDETYTDIFTQCDDFLDIDGNDNTANDDTDGITWFNLDKNTIENNINTNTNITVFFYETTQDRDNSVNNIDISNYRNKNIPNITGNPFPIYYKLVNNINNDCTGIGEIQLQVKPIPLANTPTDFNLCDDDASGTPFDGKNSGINLRDKVDDILGSTQTETNYIVSFHTTAAGANTNADIITNDTNFTNSAPTGFVLGAISEQTIYVRVQDKNGTVQCFNDHVSFKIIVNPIPAVSNTITPFAVCDIVTPADSDPRNRIAQNIDLTSKDTEILDGKINHRVAYYATQQDAEDGNEIANSTVFQNITSETTFPTNFNTDEPGIETIFFKIFDLGGNQCGSIFATFQLLIYPEPNIPINISDYSDCDNTSDSFADDANGINGDITLKNKIPEILANYSPSEFSDFTVTFYTSLTDAESGNTALALDENIFENNTNNQTIYVRVENTKNTPIACVHTGLSFNINIKEIPDFTVMGEENIDTPRIFCLNGTPPLTLEAENPAATYDYVWTNDLGTTLGTGKTLKVTNKGKYTVTASDQSPDGCSRTRIIIVNESNTADLEESFITIIDETNTISNNNNISIAIDTLNNDLGPGDYQFALVN